MIGCFDSGKFEKVGYFKKELPNGSYSRVFSIYVNNFSDKTEIWEEIEEYAKAQMYTTGGSTTVFFFNDKLNTPDVTFVAEQFDAKYEKYCVAAYWKYPTGVEKFSKYPFR